MIIGGFRVSLYTTRLPFSRVLTYEYEGYRYFSSILAVIKFIINLLLQVIHAYICFVWCEKNAYL